MLNTAADCSTPELPERNWFMLLHCEKTPYQSTARKNRHQNTNNSQSISAPACFWLLLLLSLLVHYIHRPPTSSCADNKKLPRYILSCSHSRQPFPASYRQLLHVPIDRHQLLRLASSFTHLSPPVPTRPRKKDRHIRRQLTSGTSLAGRSEANKQTSSSILPLPSTYQPIDLPIYLGYLPSPSTGGSQSSNYTINESSTWAHMYLQEPTMQRVSTPSNQCQVIPSCHLCNAINPCHASQYLMQCRPAPLEPPHTRFQSSS